MAPIPFEEGKAMSVLWEGGRAISQRREGGMGTCGKGTCCVRGGTNDISLMD